MENVDKAAAYVFVFCFQLPTRRLAIEMPSGSLPGDADSAREVARRGRFEAEPDIVDEFESCESSGGWLPPGAARRLQHWPVPCPTNKSTLNSN